MRISKLRGCLLEGIISIYVIPIFSEGALTKSPTFVGNHLSKIELLESLVNLLCIWSILIHFDIDSFLGVPLNLRRRFLDEWVPFEGGKPPQDDPQFIVYKTSWLFVDHVTI